MHIRCMRQIFFILLAIGLATAFFVEPDTIGMQVTAGCVRMYNEDVEELYNIVPKGTKVVIVD